MYRGTNPDQATVIGVSGSLVKTQRPKGVTRWVGGLLVLHGASRADVNRESVGVLRLCALAQGRGNGNGAQLFALALSGS